MPSFFVPQPNDHLHPSRADEEGSIRFQFRIQLKKNN